MMLDGKIYRDDELIYEDVALNDVVLSRRGILRVIDFDIYVNGEYLNSVSYTHLAIWESRRII